MNTSNNQRSKYDIWSVAILILTIFRLGLFMKYPYHVYGDLIYDDMYLLNAADSLLSGEWLGKYSYVTLIKGISYPLFLAISNLLCVPYSMFLGIFYLVSSAVFCATIKEIANSRWFVYLTYILLIFSPISFDASITYRLYRNAIIFPSVLLVIACILKVYYTREKALCLSQYGWLFFLGVTFSFFYFIREDSFWLFPLLAGALFIVSIWYIWFSAYKKVEIVKRCIMLLIPIIMFLGITLGYRFVNFSYYGVNSINDRTSGSFATLTGNMIKIADASDINEKYWIPKDTFEKIIDECPSLAPHKDILSKSYSNWADESGNIRGDLSVWAFREALNSMGYYSDAKTIETYCAQVNDELLIAVENGKLSFDDAVHFTSQSRGIYWKEIPGFIRDTLTNMWNMLTFKAASHNLIESTGTDIQIRFAESITGVQTIHQPMGHTQINGWLVVKNRELNNVTVQLRDKITGEELSHHFSLYERIDVANAFPEEDNALRSGFSIVLDTDIDVMQSELTIWSEDVLIVATPLENIETENFVLCLDTFISEKLDDYTKIYNKRALELAKYIITLFRCLNNMLLYLSLGGYAVFCWNFIRKRSWRSFEPFIILSGILLSIFILEFGVTVFTGWLGANWFYSCGVAPLGHAFIIVSIAYCFRNAQEIVQKRKFKEKIVEYIIRRKK